MLSYVYLYKILLFLLSVDKIFFLFSFKIYFMFFVAIYIVKNFIRFISEKNPKHSSVLAGSTKPNRDRSNLYRFLYNNFSITSHLPPSPEQYYN